MSYNVLLEELISQTGGCGLYQWLLATIVHVGKTVATWSMLTMTFSGQDPGTWCIDNSRNGSQPLNGSDKGHCELNDTGSCDSYLYDDKMYTVVNEWDLVCDRKWIVATITTIQMAGVLVGCFVAGHIADLIGRKPTYFLSLLIIIAFNVLAYFSVSWEMYAAIRFFIGIGIGFYLTVQFNLTIELAASKWRPIIVTTPSWSLEASLFALLAWGLHDWKKIHLAIAITGAPFLLTYWFVPESFRWLVTKRKFERAEEVIESIARVNRTPKPDISKIIILAEEENKTEKPEKKYSVLDLFKSVESRKTTIGLLFTWFAASYGYYGITFGVKSLSGDLYLNMFLINIVESPAMVLTAGLVNWFGRKKVTVIFYVMSGLTGLMTGVLQYLGNPFGGQVTNAIAIVSKVGVAAGWQAMIVFTTELYPTVVRLKASTLNTMYSPYFRTIAYGVHSTAARVGGMVAPQIVFLDDIVPGILYFISGVLMMISAVVMLIFKETNGKVLEDTLEGNDRKDDDDKSVVISEDMITKF